MTKQDDRHQNSHNSSNPRYSPRPRNPYIPGGMNFNFAAHNSSNPRYPPRPMNPYIPGGMNPYIPRENSNFAAHNSSNLRYPPRPMNLYIPGGMNSNFAAHNSSNLGYPPPPMNPYMSGGMNSNFAAHNSSNPRYPPRPPTLRDLHKTVKRGIQDRQEQQDQQDQQQQQDQQNIREETIINPETVLQVRAMENETVNEDDFHQMENFKKDIANLKLISGVDREERIRQMKLIMKIFNYYKKHCRGNEDFTVQDEILYNDCPPFKRILPRGKYDSFRFDWKNFYLHPTLRELYIDKAPHLRHFHIRNWRNNDFVDKKKREKEYKKFIRKKYAKAVARRAEYNKLVNGKTSSIQQLNRKVRKGQQEQDSDED